MTKVEFSENSDLKIIGESAFAETSIEYIRIPPYVTEIRRSTFSKCTKLKQVDLIGNSLLFIERLAFTQSNLTNISIPLSVICFDFSAFRNCSNHIFVFADEKNIRDVGENITFINDSYIKFNYNENDKSAEIVESNSYDFQLFIPKLAYYNDQCYNVIGY